MGSIKELMRKNRQLAHFMRIGSGIMSGFCTGIWFTLQTCSTTDLGSCGV